MSLSPALHTPIRTPQPVTSTKSLQLTPIWQEVVKNHRFPPELDHDPIFKEISLRLEDLEWPVRQHAFRVLYDIIPVISSNRLDEGVLAHNILSKLVINLGHPAPGIRKVAAETVQRYFRKTSQSEKMLENFLQYGVREKDLVNNDQAGILRENITLGTIASLADILKPFIIPENGGYSISHSLLARILEALADKMKTPLYRDKSLEALWKLRDMVGELRFSHILEKIADKQCLLNEMNLREENSGHIQAEDNSWSDETKSENSFGVTVSRESDSFDLDHQATEKKSEIAGNGDVQMGANESSEEFSDGTDTETYTKEPTPNDLEDDTIFYQVKAADYNLPSFVPIDQHFEGEKFFEKRLEEGEKKSIPSSPRVVVEAEIQFSKNRAVTMKVMKDDQNDDRSTDNGQIDLQSNHNQTFEMEDENIVMKVFSEDETEEERRKTQRRVRFGGEVIKLRTPDSDTTDITIEIHEAEDETEGKKEPVRELVTIKPDRQTTEEEKSRAKVSPSLIPLPVAPVTKSPGRDFSPSRKPRSLSPNSDSLDSAPSSSGSEAEGRRTGAEEEADVFWQWADLGLVEDNILKDLDNKEDWKIQYQAMEQLKAVLINPRTVDKMEKPKNRDRLRSLVKCLLYQLPQGSNQQVTALALSIVSQLVETLPKEVILLLVEDIVRGLCKYVGGCKNLNVKIESVQSLKTVFGVLEPSRVIDVLLGNGCLLSSSSKLRENSLLAIMYALMTFPSDFFDAQSLLEKVVEATADVRRRVRHAALEAVAILSQFCSSGALADSVARAAARLTTPAARDQLVAAVQARLSRRLLPTISGEGLVLYALQIPASRRLGGRGNPIGADVDWILSGTGSVSTGSAKSKSQLNAAQRLEVKQATPLSPGKWAHSDKAERTLRTGAGDNPWTTQKNRTEHSIGENLRTQRESRFYKSSSTGSFYGGNVSEILKSTENLMTRGSKEFFALNSINFVNAEKEYRPEDVTWALVPISTLEEPPVGRERSQSLWAEPLGEGSSVAPLRPLYLRLPLGTEGVVLGRRGASEGEGRLRLLTPTVVRERAGSDLHYERQKKSEGRGSGDTTTRIPVLHPKNGARGFRSTGGYGNYRKISDNEENVCSSPKPSALVTASNSIGHNNSSAFLPSIHTGQTDSGYTVQKSSAANNFGEVDEAKLQDTMSQLSGLLTGSKATTKIAGKDSYPANHQTTEPETVSVGCDATESEILLEDKFQGKLFERSYLKGQDHAPTGVASAPAVVSSDGRGQTPSTSSSNSTDVGTLSGTELRLGRLAGGSGGLENGLSYRNSYNSKGKGKRTGLGKPSRPGGASGHPFPDSLKPFDRPKEGLDTCFGQLESQQWEVNMVGLSSLVRLVRHHPALVLSHLHPTAVALARHIRNLRSQVARAACQASAELFLVLKRNVEPDLDELSGPLFHRSADTNRFIRADCNNALDNMTDNVGHAKAASIIISKGTTHQNATVRTVAARLLLRLSERVGPEKLLSLPKESRDKMLQAGASLLTEGKLETRIMVKMWSRNFFTLKTGKQRIQQKISVLDGPTTERLSLAVRGPRCPECRSALCPGCPGPADGGSTGFSRSRRPGFA